MKQSAAIKDALKQWYKVPKGKVGTCQQFMKQLTEKLEREGK